MAQDLWEKLREAEVEARESAACQEREAEVWGWDRQNLGLHPVGCSTGISTVLGAGLD